MSRIGFFTAASGVISYQLGMDITANNLANVNTYGFKASRPSFADLIYTKRNNNIEEVQTGHGIKVDKTDMMFEQSSLRHTERMLDFAALDEGFFAVQTPGGNTAYTKDGAFYMTAIEGFPEDRIGGTIFWTLPEESEIPEDGVQGVPELNYYHWELCDSKGSFVLDNEGNHIGIPFDDTRTTPDYGALTERIGTVRFENPYGLDQFGDNYFIPTGASGDAIVDENIRIKQGYMEASGTNVANEMSKVIEYQRAFQLNINMVKLHDELNELVNNLR